MIMDTRVQTLLTKINIETTLEGLRRLHHEAVELVCHNFSEKEGSESFYMNLDHIHLTLMIRGLTLAQEDVKRANIGQKPKKLCWYLLGSGARFEQTLWTDQDNGILYECDNEKRIDCELYVQYFAKLGTDYLNRIGYELCDGNIMATNARWTRQKEELLIDIKKYSDDVSPESIAYLYILADINPIYGDYDLVYKVKESLLTTLNQSSLIIKRLQEHLEHPVVPLGLFRHIYTERWGIKSGQVDIKYGLYVPIVNSVKFLSMRMKIRKPSTLKRLDELRRLKVITLNQYSHIHSAFITSMSLRLWASMKFEKNNYFLSLDQLSKSNRTLLKEAMYHAKKFHHFARYWKGDCYE